MTVSYKQFPPYVEDPKDGQDRPGGVLIDLMEQAIIERASTCNSFPHKVTLLYEKYERSAARTSSPDNLDIVIPVQIDDKFKLHYKEIAMASSTGSALIVVQSERLLELRTLNERELLKRVFETLPLIGLYFIINALFGATFYFIVRFIIVFFLLEVIK